MRLIDVTRPIVSGMTVWPGDEAVLVERTSSISDGSMVNISQVRMGVHTGTHVDAPLHFIDHGRSIDEVDTSLFSGWVHVVDARGKEIIRTEHITHLVFREEKAVFFRTSYSDKTLNGHFDKNYTGLSIEAARYLLDHGIRVIGTDALSIERFGEEDFSVHKTLLRNDVLIVEGLCLSNVVPGRYRYICMPLLLKGSDGSPARVILIAE